MTKGTVNILQAAAYVICYPIRFIGYGIAFFFAFYTFAQTGEWIWKDVVNDIFD